MKIITEGQIEKFISHSNAIEDEKMEMDEGSRNAWNYLIINNTLTSKIICDAHGMLMREKEIQSKYKGAFRDVIIFIGREKKDNAISIGNELQSFCENFNSHLKKGNMLATGWHLLRHKEFEGIHPFIDGNGRIGRLIFLWGMLKNNKDFEYFNIKKRQDYYKLFEKSPKVEGYLSKYK